MASRRSGKREEFTEGKLAGGVAWRQGLVWIVVLPPYGLNDVYTTDRPPPAIIHRIDVGGPWETLAEVETGAPPPQAEFVVPWGLFNIHYKDGTLTYLPGRGNPNPDPAGIPEDERMELELLGEPGKPRLQAPPMRRLRDPGLGPTVVLGVRW